MSNKSSTHVIFIARKIIFNFAYLLCYGEFSFKENFLWKFKWSNFSGEIASFRFPWKIFFKRKFNIRYHELLTKFYFKRMQVISLEIHDQDCQEFFLFISWLSFAQWCFFCLIIGDEWVWWWWWVGGSLFFYPFWRRG